MYKCLIYRLAAIAALSTALCSAADENVQAQLKQMQAQLDAQQQEIAQLRAAADINWLNKRRREEIRTVIQEVLADADIRPSLTNDGIIVGHNGTSFFLKTSDNRFFLKIYGQVHVRYIANFRNNAATGALSRAADRAGKFDDTEAGFQIRRAYINLAGHVGTPRFKFCVSLASSRDSETTNAEQAWVSYNVTDDLFVRFGRFKAFFLHDENTSNRYFLTVERAFANEVNTVGFVEGVELRYKDERVHAGVAVHDGAMSGEFGGIMNDFEEDAADVALTTRVEVKLIGDWKQRPDATSWVGEGLAIFVGGGIHAEFGETGESTVNADFLTWTVDFTIEKSGFNATAAVIGRHVDNDTAADANTYALIVQAGYQIIAGKLEPFVRYERLFGDSADALIVSDIDIVTVGFNWYIKQHHAKLTVDVVYVLDTMPASLDGIGLLGDGAGQTGQIAIRTQFQLLF